MCGIISPSTCELSDITRKRTAFRHCEVLVMEQCFYFKDDYKSNYKKITLIFSNKALRKTRAALHGSAALLNFG